MFQLNAPFLYYIFHIPLHVSSNNVLIMRIHCIHTASGSLCVTLLRWPLSAQAVRGITITKMHGQQHTKIATDVQNKQQSINPTPFALWCVLSAEHVLHQQVIAFTNILIFIVTYLSWLHNLALCVLRQLLSARTILHE